MALSVAPTRLLLAMCIALCTSSCTHIQYAAVQAEYARIQNVAPGQLNVKHMIDRENYFVHGRGVDPDGRYAGLPKVIAAFSSKFSANELVDSMYFEVTGSHYGLNLPEGSYDLLVYADIDRDGIFGPTEVVGIRPIELNAVTAPERVLGQVDVRLNGAGPGDLDVSIEVPDVSGRSESLFYPSGTIRSLDDPVFDQAMSTLGMYDPASFLEQAPIMFYALEEDVGYKIPVVFVHGIDGSARNFEDFVDQLDHTRYKAWFFHYPSGGDLEQLAELFYRIYFSGKLYNANGMPIIVVAHSMGGLVVREAINRYQGKSSENQLHLFVSIASPFGGHAAAAKGEEHGLIVLPSWQDLNPENDFISGLFREPLPEFTHHELVYAYRNPGAIKLGENSDGVVALTSQLHPPAQRQASGQFGFDNTHTSVLKSNEVAVHIRNLMDRVENVFPPAQLSFLHQGGYDVLLDDDYSILARHSIRNYGKYLMALTMGTLETFHPEEDRFISVANGESSPRDQAEEDWLRFLREYPELKGE